MWISVKDKLPESYTFVLATIQSTTNETWVEIVGFAEGSFHLPGRGKTSFVSHWMPIPSPATI